MKTQNELQDLKAKVEELEKELKELSDEELKQVCGGLMVKVSGTIMRN